MVDKEEKIKIGIRNRIVDGYPNEKVLQEFCTIIDYLLG